jgi:hypothetical protein
MDYKELLEKVRQPTSDQMIRDWIRKYRPNLDVNIISYPEIKKYNSLDTLLGKDNACIILYSVGRQECGHWCMINRPNEREIEFFDTYANYLDSAITNKRLRFSNDYPYLSRLVKEDGRVKKILFNNMKLQTLDRNSNVCGRWVCFRYATKELPLNIFLREIRNAGFKPYDLLSVIWTYDM